MMEQAKVVIIAVGHEFSDTVSWSSRALAEDPVLLIELQQFLARADVPILNTVRVAQASVGAVAWKRVPTFASRALPQLYPSGDLAFTVQPSKIVIEKKNSSAFCGTNLLSRREQARTDTLFIVAHWARDSVRTDGAMPGSTGYSPPRVSSAGLRRLNLWPPLELRMKCARV
jgi:nicotinamidase-related amidase